MTVRRTLVAALLLAFTASPAAAQQRTRSAKSSLKQKKTTTRAKQRTRASRTRKSPRQRLNRLSSKLFGKRQKLTGRALESKLSNPFSPTISGQTRTWKVNSNGAVSTMKETVKRTEVDGKHLKAEVHYSNGKAKWTSVTQTMNGEVMVAQLDKLGAKPAKGVTVYGVAMPRRLRLGKSWTNIVSQNDGSSSRQTEYRVVKAVQMKDTKGVMRDGFQIATKDVSRVRVDGKVVREVNSTGSYTVLRGVGMVKASNTVNGVTVTQTLASIE